MDSYLYKKTLNRIYGINWIFSRLSGRKPGNSIAFGEVGIMCSMPR
jgi:hypothetical protein